LGVGNKPIDYTEKDVEIVSFLADVAWELTIRKRAEETLIISNGFNKHLLQTIPFGMDIVDKDGNILFINESFEKYFGKNINGKKCWEIYNDNKTQCPGCPLQHEIEIGVTETYETQPMITGNVFEISHTGIMFQGEKAMLEIFHNITERKRASIHLQNYTEELKLLNESKDKFFSIIAHDIRSPFTGFLGLSTILVEDIDSLTRDEIQEHSRELNLALHKQYELLTDLLDWARLQNKNFTLTKEIISQNNELMKIIEPLSLTAKQKQIDLINNVKDDISVFADFNMLKLVIRNLISNSIKFTNAGGWVKVSTVKGDEFIQIEVSDNGVGISPNNLSKLFHDDVRYTTEGTSKEKGTGLGLLMCKEIVEKHGGKIWVESEVDKGSTFKFTLPLRSGDQ